MGVFIQFGPSRASENYPGERLGVSPLVCIKVACGRQREFMGHIDPVILIVDDDPMVLRMTGAILKNHGFKVVEANSGEEGLKRFTEHHTTVGLVLTDVVMPSMTGPEMIERILALDPTVPVLFMSGCTGVLRLPEAARRLSKPFAPEALIQSVRACLHSRGARPDQL